MVRAKFRCVEKLDRATNWGGQSTHEATTVKMAPVYAQSGPNKSWSDATPSGEISMHITNKAAFDAFELGKCYFVDFTLATEEE